jgi:tetratricopeptide (TPR) repeat protein
MEQLDKAIELLKTGLRDGKIESERNTYELLGYALTRQHREFEAIDVYKEAAKHFKTGQFDATIAQQYYSLNQYPEALKYAEIAISKGELDNEFGTLMFATYVAFELKDYEKAFKYVSQAQPLAKAERDVKDAAGLKKAVEDQLKLIEDEKKAKEAAANPTP